MPATRTPEPSADQIRRLLDTRGSACFVCEEPLNPSVVVVARLVPDGTDEFANLVPLHASCAETSATEDLRIARLLVRFERLKERNGNRPGRPSLSDVLRSRGGGRYGLPLRITGDKVEYAFPELGQPELRTTPLLHDPLSGMDYFFTVLPTAYLIHDERINPRAIATVSLLRLAEEFAAGRPQLHPAIAWTSVQEGRPRSAIGVFDGQHKVAAQVLLGVDELPVRVFVNPDLEVLLAANTRAGTVLRQVAFDASARRRLRSQRFAELVDRYLLDHGLPLDSHAFSERDLARHFPGRLQEVRQALLDDLRESVTYHPNNRLRPLIALAALGARGAFGGEDRPLAMPTVERTIYRRFIYQGLLEATSTGKDDPRIIEREQILRLLGLLAERIYEGSYDPSIGTRGLERRLQAGEAIPEDHVRACRLSDPGVFGAVIGLVSDAPRPEEDTPGPFLRRLPETAWQRIEQALDRVVALSLWTAANTHELFTRRHPSTFWDTVLRTGRPPDGVPVLHEPSSL